ncbi:FtsX-like permease family protein [Planobispora rosea]|uniref:FtsX-like permease family protein n=1 Tax=Planobispora rosea TaxID=35762 RepID=UPI00083AFBEA|nr:ABC transporter permease [Planobispora rosea]
MWGLALSTLRYRRSAFVAGFLAVFLGAAIITACGGLMETGIRLDVPPQRLAGADVVVTGDQVYTLPKANPSDEDEDTQWGTLPERVRLEASLVAKLGQVPGVKSAVADVSFPVVLDGAPVTGASWPSAALSYRIAEGKAPAGAGEIALGGGGHAVGDEVEVAVRGEIATFRVSGLVTGAQAPGVFFPAGEADRLSGHPGRIDAVAVVGDVTPEQLKGALAGVPAVALTDDDRGLAEFPRALTSSESLIVIAAVFGAMAIMVAMFVVAGTLGLAVQQRQREIALLRAIGTTPGQVRRMVLAEAMAVSALATVIGAFAGFFVGRWLFDRLVGAGVVPAEVVFRHGLLPAVVGVAVSLLTAFLAAYVTARRAANARPTAALAEAEVPAYRGLRPVRRVIAGVCFLGGIALALVTVLFMSGPLSSSTAGPAVLVWVLGLALLAPAITTALVKRVRLSGPMGYLAVHNARSRALRVSAAVVPVMLATGMATANLYMQTTQLDATERAFTDSISADAVLTSADGGLPAGLLAEVRKLPQVGAEGASELVTSTAYVEKPHDNWQREEGWPVQGVTPEGVARTLTLRPDQGNLADLRGDTIALEADHAAAIGDGVGIGDTVTVRLGDRSAVELKVVALFSARTGAEKFLVPAEVLAPHTTAGAAPQILVKAAPGTSSDELTGALAGLAGKWPGVMAADRAALTAGHAEAQQTQAMVNYLLVGLILAYTAISMVNTQVMATARRAREFGLQRLVGSTKAQVIRMMTLESLMVAAFGVLLGTIASLITLVPFAITIGATPFPSGSPMIYLGVVAFAVLLTLAGTLVPAWQAMRDRPADAAKIAAAL